MQVEPTAVGDAERQVLRIRTRERRATVEKRRQHFDCSDRIAPTDEQIHVSRGALSRIVVIEMSSRQTFEYAKVDSSVVEQLRDTDEVALRREYLLHLVDVRFGQPIQEFVRWRA